MTDRSEHQRRINNRRARQILAQRAAEYHRQKYGIHMSRAEVASPFTSWLHRLRGQRSLTKARLHGMQQQRYSRGTQKFEKLQQIARDREALAEYRARLKRNRELFARSRVMPQYLPPPQSER